MGEKKRRTEATLKGPCPCNSGRPAYTCCIKGTDWHKAPTVLGLQDLTPGTSLTNCYMNSLRSCVGPISREHYVSEAVLRVLMADGELSISGLPWLQSGETRILPTNSIVGKCLCSKHNSALSPLDETAKYFFESLKSYLENRQGFGHALVSGHDMERWLLKTVKAIAASKNFAKSRNRLSGAFSNDQTILNMLDNPASWPDGAGLYCLVNLGDKIVNHPRFQLQPFMNDNNEIEGIAINILGLTFFLLLDLPNLTRYPFLTNAKYRPGRIVISYPFSTKWVTMSWTDQKVHDHLGLTFDMVG